MVSRDDIKKVLSKYSILIVDDEEITLETTSLMAKHYFKDVFTAKNGCEGIEIYKKKLPSLILSDVSMPKCDGIKMAKEIKEIDSNAKIIFLTGHEEEEYKNYDITKEYIVKPISTGKFIGAIFQVLEIES